MLIKSLTPPKSTLSARFPIVPAKKSTKIRSEKCFFLHNQKKSQIPTNEIPITIGKYKPIPREIPVLKTGSKIRSSCPRLRS